MTPMQERTSWLVVLALLTLSASAFRIAHPTTDPRWVLPSAPDSMQAVSPESASVIAARATSANVFRIHRSPASTARIDSVAGFLPQQPSVWANVRLSGLFGPPYGVTLSGGALGERTRLLAIGDTVLGLRLYSVRDSVAAFVGRDTTISLRLRQP